MEFERVVLEEEPYIYVDKEVPYGPEIAQAMGAAFGEVFTFATKQGLTPLSAPMSVYVGMDPKILRFRGGVKVSANDAKKVTGPIKADALPAGPVMMGVHKGPYQNLNQSHGAMWDHMKAKDIPGTFPIWEIYIDDPGEVAEDNLRTEIYRAIG